MFALLACQYGAGEVIAIEPDPSIEVARQIAIANGYADRIRFVRDLSTNWQPLEKADVVISDIRGVMPLFEHHIPTIKDMRARLLKPDGIQIPGVDRIYAALVEAPAEYHRCQRPWLENGYGVDLSAAYPYVMNNWTRAALSPEALLSEPQLFATLDYRVIEEANHRATLRLAAGRPGTAHGLLMWFETELAPSVAPGVGYSNAPGAPEQVYGQAFFPLERPVDLTVAAAVEVSVSANFVNGQYVWNWASRGTDAMGQAFAFRQSSFKSEILVPGQLAPRASNFCPPASIWQEIDQYCLARFDGKTDLASIARQLVAAFPAQLATEAAALDRVADLSARYNKS